MMGGMFGGAAGVAGGGGTTGTTSGSSNDVVSIGIKQNASQNAQGMAPEGQAVRLSLQQGQTAEAQIQLQGGRCYTLIGGSTPGVLETQIIVTMPSPLQNQVLGQNAAGMNPMPVVWGGGNCYRSPSPIPMPVRVEVTMKTGTGTIGIQPYSK